MTSEKLEKNKHLLKDTKRAALNLVKTLDACLNGYDAELEEPLARVVRAAEFLSRSDCVEFSEIFKLRDLQPRLDLNTLKHGYFGVVHTPVSIGPKQLLLCEVNLADPASDAAVSEWAEWYLVDPITGAETRIALCDGHNGVEELVDSETLRKLIGYSPDAWEASAVWDRVSPYQYTGRLEAAARKELLEIATEQTVGPVSIWRTLHYYENSEPGITSTEDFLRGEDDVPLVFDSYTQAEEYIEQLEEGRYTLGPGEYAPPTYQIITTD